MVPDGLTMHPAVHRPIPDGPWIQCLRRKSGDPNLFIYRHTGTGRFVVAEWLVKPAVYGQGLAACQELFTLSGPPDHWPDDLPPMEWAVQRCRPAREMIPEAQRRRRAYEQNRGEEVVETNVERAEAARFVRKRGAEDTAFAIERGINPYIGKREGGEEQKQIADILLDAVGGKTISIHGDKSPKPKHKSFG